MTYEPVATDGPVDPPAPSPIRPRRAWYVVAIVLVIAGVAAGLALFLVALRPALSDFRQFAAGSGVTLHLDKGERHAIYADSGAARPVCTVSPAGATLRRSGGTTRVSNSSGDWYSVYELTADRAGSYRLTCTGDAGAALAVGPYQSIGSLLLAIVGAIGCPCVALAAATAISLVVVVRRNGARKRAAAAGPVS